MCIRDRISAIAYVQRRMGNWDAAVANLRRALRLDPFSLSNIDGLTRTLTRLHRIEEAEEVIDRALEFVPDNVGLLFWKVALTYYTGQESSELQAALREYTRLAPPSAAAFLLEEGDIYLRDYQSALGRRTAPSNPTSSDSVYFYIRRGYIYRLMYDSGMSRAYYDSARVIGEERVRTDPEVALFHADLAQACAGVGQKHRAVQEGELAAELLPVSKDEMLGPDILESLAMVYIMVGEYDLTIDQLDYLLSHPSNVQIEGVRQHPIYDPLRDHPRFQALIEKYEKEHGP